MSKPKKRFQSAEQIEAEIDKVKARALRYDQDADAAHTRAYAMMRGEIPETPGKEDAASLIEKRDRLRKISRSIHETTIPRLKERIGVMLTQASPYLVGEDPSIPTERKTYDKR